MNALEKILEEIDREIYKQREICNEVLDTPGYRLYERTMKRAKDIVERHIDDVKDTNVPTNDDWIPCSERLPNQNGVYNVTRLIDDAFISDSAYFDGQNTWHNDNRVNHARSYLTDIVAWQPLPEPYKPKKK